MKTLITIFFVLLLSAACIPGITAKHNRTQTTNKATVVKRDQFTNKDAIITATPSKTTLLVYLGRYTSSFRSFMPYDEDPCNHLPSRKSLC
jgi:hypothetical protein